MGYVGGKHRIRYEVAEYINALTPKFYLEAFCGLCWVGEQVRARRRVFSDLNQDVILMWQALKKGWNPPNKITEEEYDAIRKNKTPSALRGFAGTHCAFGGVFLSTYARSADGTNFAQQGARVLKRRMRTMSANSEWHYLDYARAIECFNEADVIYLDPPYIGTTSYSVNDSDGGFDHEVFWQFVREHSDGTRRILVSEYVAPADFTVVLETTSRMGLATKAEGGGLQKDLRREIVVEYNPPRLRKRVVFDKFF